MTLDPVVTNPNLASWLPAQEHAGHNIGDTPTHVIFVELKNSPVDLDWMDLGPV